MSIMEFQLNSMISRVAGEVKFKANFGTELCSSDSFAALFVLFSVNNLRELDSNLSQLTYKFDQSS